MSGPGFAVIDFETTGLFPGGHDRIVEAAVVHVSNDGRVTGRWDTLVNPERDLGPQRIHGIRSVDVLDAPTFSQVMPGLVELLDERVIVAHNASFDTRFLLAELQRAHYVADVPLVSLCTMQLARELLPGAGRSLADCCAAFDIELDGAHRASVDASATAQLLDAYIASAGNNAFWTHYLDAGEARHWAALTASASIEVVWCPRGQRLVDPGSFLQRITVKLPDVSGPAAHQDYLALLDRCLLDRALSAHEADALVHLAEELGLSRDTCARLNLDYFDALARAAWDDGALTTPEISDLAAVASLLTVPVERLARAMQQPSVLTAPTMGSSDAAAPVGTFRLEAGDQVVLTGEMSRPRSNWETELTQRGLVPKSAITKAVRLLVAADCDSLSGKAGKARQYGIPIVDEATLGRLLNEMAPASV